MLLKKPRIRAESSSEWEDYSENYFCVGKMIFQLFSGLRNFKVTAQEELRLHNNAVKVV